MTDLLQSQWAGRKWVIIMNITRLCEWEELPPDQNSWECGSGATTPSLLKRNIILKAMSFCSVISDLQIHYATLQSFKIQTHE